MATTLLLNYNHSSAACGALPGSRVRDEEAVLIRKAVQGDLESFNCLVLKYQEMAYNHALGLMNDPNPAEDVTQESFIKAYQKIDTFQGGSFRAWLLSIVTHTAYDHLRQTVRHPAIALTPENDDGEEMESAPWLVDTAPSVQSTVEAHELSRSITAALAQLPDPFRGVLILIDIYEMDYQEAAAALHIPVGTVRSRLARARLRLRETLRDQ